MLMVPDYVLADAKHVISDTSGLRCMPWCVKQQAAISVPLSLCLCSIEVHVTEPLLMSQRDDAVVYRGEGEKFARRLSKVIHGGQVVLSETAWASIQDQIPGQSQVCDLSPKFAEGYMQHNRVVYSRPHITAILAHITTNAFE